MFAVPAAGRQTHPPAPRWPSAPRFPASHPLRSENETKINRFCLAFLKTSNIMQEKDPTVPLYLIEPNTMPILLALYHSTFLTSYKCLLMI